MRASAIGMMGALMLAGALFLAKDSGFSAVYGDRLNGQFTGEISDSFCAENGSHAGRTKSNRDHTKAACVLACVNLDGAQFVLYNTRTKRTYLLDDQVQPTAFAGQKVIVSGNYDETTKTIHVRKIRPLIENAL